MPQHERTDVYDPDPAGGGLTRRRALGLALAAGAGALAAACGEAEPAEILLPPRDAEQRTAAAPTASVVIERGERAPSREGGLPDAGAEYPISLALPTFGGSNYDVEPILLTAQSAVRFETKGRYRYSEVQLPSNFGYRWDYAKALDDGSGGSRTDLVILEQWDLENLVSNQRLLPLDEHLASDATFDPGAYWPGILETGKVDGVQYALPVAAAPWVTVVNRDLAATAGFEVPPRQAWDGETFVRGAAAMHRDPNVQGAEDSVGVGINVEPMWMAPDQLWSDAPSFIFLQSSLGVVPDSQGSFAALRSPEALTTVQTFHDLATTKGVSQAQRDRGTDVYDLLYQGRIGLMLVPLSGNWFGYLTSSSLPSENVLYPFPSFGAGQAPASVWMMLGIGAGVADPKVAYDALRALERHTQDAANVPARRTSAQDLKLRFPSYRDDEAQMVVDLMHNASYVTLSRAQWGAFVNEVDAGVILEGQSASQALDAVARRLEEMGARV